MKNKAIKEGIIKIDGTGDLLTWTNTYYKMLKALNYYILNNTNIDKDLINNVIDEEKYEDIFDVMYLSGLFENDTIVEQIGFYKTFKYLYDNNEDIKKIFKNDTNKEAKQEHKPEEKETI